jgi:uncharacterized protein YndB with AHSA1/START domain
MNTRVLCLTAPLLAAALAGCTACATPADTPKAAQAAPSEPAMPQQQTKKHDLVVTRTFDAPVAQVWSAWSNSDHVMRWWGPTGFTSPSCRMDFRVGGASLVCMRAPQAFGGQDMYNTWTYTEIVPHQRIAFTLRFCDKDANAFDPASQGMPPGIPSQVPHIITFKQLGPDKTEMTVSEFGYGDEQTVAMSKLGLDQCLDKMAASFANP